MVPEVIDRAYVLHATACKRYGFPGERRLAATLMLAMPFGKPEDMPPHEWRVSPDVYQALYAAMPPPYPMANWKSGDDGTTRLFGWVCSPDPTLPADTMRLELVG